jgi:hypothetical protein
MADVTFQAFAGINNVLPAERIHALPTKDNATCDLVTAVNVDIDDSGQISRRAGQALKVPGAAHSIWSQGDDCLFAAGGQLRRLNPDFTSTALTPLASDAPVCYVAVNGRIYWTNGTDTGVIVAGASRSWGMVAADMPQLTAIVGQMTAGLYQAAITYVRDDGQESGAGMSSKVTLTDDAGVRFAWADPLDADVVEVNLYLSEPNGMVLYLAATVDVAAGTADVTNPSLSLPLDSQWMDKPPPGSHLAYHNGRIYIADGAFVFGTTALGFEHVDLRDYLALDNTPIAFLAGVAGGLYIGTAKAVYFAAGDRLEQFTRKTVIESPAVAGSAVLAEGFAVSGRAELSGRQVVLFATAAGVCMGMEDGSVSSLTQARYNPPALTAGAGLFRDSEKIKQYMLFQPV